jgi:hypothetical protein
MNDLLEQRLRETYADHDANYDPTDAAERLCARAYKPRTARRGRPFRRLQALSRVSQVAVALASLSVFAGVAVAAYVVFAGGAARELPAFECETAARVTTIIPAITGSPLVDCAASWPQATGGRTAAPPLAIWGADDGQRLVAVAGPVSAGPPADGDQFHWQRLPDSWTVDLPVVALNDQLSNISLPFNSGITNTCSFRRSDIAAVRSLLHADGLDAWHVTLRAQSGQLSSGCRIVFAANVDAQHRTVELLQASPQAEVMPATSGTTLAPVTTSTAATTSTATSSTTPPNVASPTLGDSYAQSLAHDARLAQARLKEIYTAVNARLSANCESVANAAALWNRAARTAGFRPATLAFWRQANDGKRPDPRTFPYHYTLYQQPASQNTGDCAHMLVMVVPGSGLANVYAARIAP